MTINQLKAPSLVVKYGMNLWCKFLNGMDGTEKDFYNLSIAPVYIDYDNEEYDIKESVAALISFICNDLNVHLGSSLVYETTPYAKFVDENKKKISGNVGAGMTEKGTAALLMKFSGLDDEIKNLIKNSPIIVKHPSPFAV